MCNPENLNSNHCRDYSFVVVIFVFVFCGRVTDKKKNLFICSIIPCSPSFCFLAHGRNPVFRAQDLGQASLGVKVLALCQANEVVSMSA